MANQPWVDGQSVGQILRQTAQRYPDHDAVVFWQADLRLSWGEFDNSVDEIARALLALGFQHGDHFGVWATNWPEWVLLQFATARIGLVLVTINPSYRPAELAYAISQSDIRGLAMIEQFKATNYDKILTEICREIASSQPGELNSSAFPKLKCIIRIRGADHSGMLSWSDFFNRASEVESGV